MTFSPFFAICVWLWGIWGVGDALVVEEAGGNITGVFGHLPAEFGPDLPVGTDIMADVVLASPVGQCYPSNSAAMNGSAVLFRDGAAAACNGTVLSYCGLQTLLVAQLAGASFAIVTNCAKGCQDQAVALYLPPVQTWPSDFVFPVVLPPWPITIPTISISCSSADQITAMNGTLRAILDARGNLAPAQSAAISSSSSDWTSDPNALAAVIVGFTAPFVLIAMVMLWPICQRYYRGDKSGQKSRRTSQHAGDVSQQSGSIAQKAVSVWHPPRSESSAAIAPAAHLPLTSALAASRPTVEDTSSSPTAVVAINISLPSSSDGVVGANHIAPAGPLPAPHVDASPNPDVNRAAANINRSAPNVNPSARTAALARNSSGPWEAVYAAPVVALLPAGAPPPDVPALAAAWGAVCAAPIVALVPAPSACAASRDHFTPMPRVAHPPNAVAPLTTSAPMSCIHSATTHADA